MLAPSSRLHKLYLQLRFQAPLAGLIHAFCEVYSDQLSSIFILEEFQELIK
jgi:hypothetical protein